MEIDFNKKNETFLNAADAPIKKRKWDRYLYLFILALIVLSLLKWLVPTWIFNYADGLLLQHQYDAKFTQDTRVVKYIIKEGQYVKKGDPLFYYEQITSNSDHQKYTQDSLKTVLEANKAQANLIALDAEILKRKHFIQDLEKRIVYWKKIRPQKEKLAYLDVINPNEISTVDRTLDDISAQLANTKTEYLVLLQERNKVQANISQSNYISRQQNNLLKNKNVFYAPISGTVDRLRIDEGQVGIAGDIVTSVLYPEYFVKAYIDIGDLDKFKINDQVLIQLPYGFNNTLKGKISKIYSVSEVKDTNLYKNDKNNADKSGIVMDIIPLNNTSWKDIKVSNIPVKVRKIVFR